MGEPNRDLPNSLSSRSPALDGIRGLAILAVMVYHESIMTSQSFVDKVASRIFQSGWCGVDLFFVLSGYLITGILLDTKASRNYFRSFYGRRILRIWPLYYGIVLLCFGLLPFINHAKTTNFAQVAGDKVWYLLFLQNYLIAWHGIWRHAILDVTWSLAIEEQFYLVWPIVVLLIKPRTLQWVCFALLGVSLALRIAAFAYGTPAIAVYVCTPTRFDGLAAGALVAVTLRRAPPQKTLLRLANFGLFICGILLVLIWSRPGGYSFDKSRLTATVGTSLIAIFAAALLTVVVHAPPASRLARFLSLPILRMFGKYSFAMYLFHLPLRALIRDTVFGANEFFTIGGSQLPAQLIFFGLATSLTLVVSILSWQLIEKRALNLKRYFPL